MVEEPVVEEPVEADVLADEVVAAYCVDLHDARVELKPENEDTPVEVVVVTTDDVNPDAFELPFEPSVLDQATEPVPFAVETPL